MARPGTRTKQRATTFHFTRPLYVRPPSQEAVRKNSSSGSSRRLSRAEEKSKAKGRCARNPGQKQITRRSNEWLETARMKVSFFVPTMRKSSCTFKRDFGFFMVFFILSSSSHFFLYPSIFDVVATRGNALRSFASRIQLHERKDFLASLLLLRDLLFESQSRRVQRFDRFFEVESIDLLSSIITFAITENNLRVV